MIKQYVCALSIHIVCAAAMLTAAGPAWSALNKCMSKDGKVLYTEQPCEQDQTKATVKIVAAPAPEGQGSGPRKNRVRSPSQEAQCEKARRAVESLKKEVADERHKNKTDLLASAKQEIAATEQLIREQCSP